MTSAKPSPLTSPRATEEPAASSMPAPSILNPFDPSRFATLMTDEIPGMTISPISQESAARCLQDEIFRRGIDDPVQLDLEVGNPVAVEIAADDRNVVGSAGLIELLVAKFACTAVKVLRADESEGLIALFGRVRIDARKIDLVLSRMEVSDDIAGAGPGRRVGNRVEIEHIVTCTARQRVLTKTTGEQVIASAAAQRAVTIVTDQDVRAP